MRLGDAERERLYEQLAAHAAAGRLDVPEHERRLDIVSRARTHEDGLRALADLPPLPAPSRGRPRRRGHNEAQTPAADWQPTPERFRDPRTGDIMRVWVDAAGGRHYVAESP